MSAASNFPLANQNCHLPPPLGQSLFNLQGQNATPWLFGLPGEFEPGLVVGQARPERVAIELNRLQPWNLFQEQGQAVQTQLNCTIGTLFNIVSYLTFQLVWLAMLQLL